MFQLPAVATLSLATKLKFSATNKANRNPTVSINSAVPGEMIPTHNRNHQFRQLQLVSGLWHSLEPSVCNRAELARQSQEGQVILNAYPSYRPGEK